jgi:hypothetical protein
MSPPRMLTKKEDVIIYEWVLAMGECGLLISLNQFKLKVT